MTDAYLTEALDLVDQMTAGAGDDYPIGLLRLRWLLERMQTPALDVDDETMTLTEEPPTDSMHPEGI